VKTEEAIERRMMYTAPEALILPRKNTQPSGENSWGVSFALKKFRKFLMGNHFLVRTDTDHWMDFSRPLHPSRMKIYET
jgi:hypothetical protein